MKIVDLSHAMSTHTPGWVGYGGNKMYYASVEALGEAARAIKSR